MADCIRSIQSTAAAYDREIIVVDNASADGTPEVIENEFPEVRMIRNSKNLGFAKANNIGIQASQGRYLCLANSDTIVQADAIDTMCKFMDTHPEVAVLGPKLLWKDRTLQLSCRKFPSLWNTLCPALGLTRLYPKTSFFSGEHMQFFAHNRTLQVDALVGAFLMVRRKAVEEIGLMDEDYFFYCEEIDWCKRFKEAGWKNVFYPAAEVVHLGQGSASQDPVNFKREFVQSNCRYWKKHHHVIKRIFFCLIILCRYSSRLVVNSLLYLARPQLRKQIQVSLNSSLEAINVLFSMIFSVSRE